MTHGPPFLHRQRFECVLHVLYVDFNHGLRLFSPHMYAVYGQGQKPCRWDCGWWLWVFCPCRFMTTEGEERERRKKKVSFQWLLSIAKSCTFPPCGVFLSGPCLVQPPVLNFFHSFPVVLRDWKAWFMEISLKNSQYFLFTVSKFLSVDSLRCIYFLCPFFCATKPVCGGPC